MSGFGDRLKEARTMRQFTQQQLAILCDTEEAVIRSYEKERISPGKSMMLRLFNALNMPPDFFFQDELKFNSYKVKSDIIADMAKLSPAHCKLIRLIIDNLTDK